MKLKTIILAAVVVATMTACDDTLNSELTRYTPTTSITMPAGLESSRVVSEQWEVKDVSSGRKTTYSSSADMELKPGLYDVSYDAEVELDGTLHHVSAYRQSVAISAATHVIALTAFENLVNDDFIIEEVFFSGTLHTSGNQYNGDDYIKIYNNTDHVLYADGLSIVESKFTTTQKFDYMPDLMNECMTVQAIYTIPGSGTEHPVQPGESLLIADTGIDHRVANPNSFDLSHADFEWYDISSQPAHMDIDGPTVENLDKWYCYTLSFWILHNRGFKAWALARIPLDKETYLANYYYTYNYVMVLPAGTFPMSQSAFKLPNEWIVDAVNAGVASDYVWNVTAPALDRGWTHCGSVDKDKTRYFHSVRRKMLYLKDGRRVLKDTNNSTEDFNPDCVASEIELQGTAMDVDGTRCTTITYDGVTPVANALQP